MSLIKSLQFLIKKLPIFASKKPSKDLIREASEEFENGDKRKSLKLFQKYLKKNPKDASAWNNIGICFAYVGDHERASSAFEIAWKLDDNLPEGLANRAKFLLDSFRIKEALEFIRDVIVSHPQFNYYSLLGMALFGLGKVNEARVCHLRAWLRDIRNIRFANSFVFQQTYWEADELLVAAEHRFWGDLALSLNGDMKQESSPPNEALSKISRRNEKIRICYWSPDFRNHSVVFFILPVLEKHDRSKFEVIALHDSSRHDRFTAKVQSLCDEFYDIFLMSDDELKSLIKKLEIDVLVELSGHSSANRINMLSGRLAKYQISALGYPPTSGLSTIDGKVIDRFISTRDDSKIYSERPLILPSSFWCYSPPDEIEIDHSLRDVKSSNFTFGCFGNISKITDEIIRVWARIVRRVDRSRLIIRSVNFEDLYSLNQTAERFSRNDFPMDRVTFLGPLKIEEYLSGYHEVDLIFDTYPFNGGTTSCAALYMGVPIVTRCGKSLASRMGFSVLSNVNLNHLVADDYLEYENIAVNCALNPQFLGNFRETARSRFKSSSLGNSEKYTKEFESAIFELMQGENLYSAGINLLPAEVIARRAFKILEYGDLESAKLMCNYLVSNYPSSGLVGMLQAQITRNEEHLDDSAESILRSLNFCNEHEKISALIMLVQIYIDLGRFEDGRLILMQLKDLSVKNDYDRVHLEIYQNYLKMPSFFSEDHSIDNSSKTSNSLKLQFIVVCNEEVEFIRCRDNLNSLFNFSNYKYTVVQCAANQRASVYRNVDLALDLVVIIHPHVTLFDDRIIDVLTQGLESADIIGYWGCSRWNQIHWRSDNFEKKAGGYCVSTTKQGAKFNYRFTGVSVNEFEHGMSILDGSFLVLRPETLVYYDGVAGLEIDHPLCEEIWTHMAHRKGCRLAVCRNLRLHVTEDFKFDRGLYNSVFREIVKELDFDISKLPEEDQYVISLPIDDVNQTSKLFIKSV